MVSVASHGNRDLWKSKRERNRLIARYKIRQRVNFDKYGDDQSDDKEILQSAANEALHNTSRTSSDDTILTSILLGVLKSDRSKFSATFMDQHHTLFSTTIDTTRFKQLTSDNKDFPNICDHTMHLVEAWSGKDKREKLQRHFDVIECFTIYEFATWLGRASVISALLLGGISPTIRGLYRMPNTCVGENDNTSVKERQDEEMAQIGRVVMKRFFDRLPLRLSTYLVARVMEARWNAYWSFLDHSDEVDLNTHTSTCPVCNDANLPLNSRLLFLPCGNTLCTCCEACTWKHLLDTIDNQPGLNDVFSCPVDNSVCDMTIIDSFIDSHAVTSEQYPESCTTATPQSRKEECLRKFHELPVDQNALKQQRRHIKKKKPSEASHVAQNWRDAIFPSLGTSQDVRAEKFAHYVDENAVHFVRACLEAGVDIDCTNEYGQTPLQVAGWRRFNQVVDLLLHFGADPALRDNGGVSYFDISDTRDGKNEYNTFCYSLNVQQEPTNSATVNLRRRLDEYNNRSKDSTNNSGMPPIVQDPHVSVLIPFQSDHDGAGSFLIDKAISETTVDALLDLFYSVPVHPKQRTKKQQASCSDRSYFCDTTGIVQGILCEALEKVGMISVNQAKPCGRPSSCLDCSFFPHMRFLDYSSQGIVLAPHVDLSRNHPLRFTAAGDDGNIACQDEQIQGGNDSIVVRSTHTFILYLTDCYNGGATRLLRDVSGEGQENTFATVQPRRGRLLLFPHSTPHEGLEVLDVPKILLRGEARLGDHDASAMKTLIGSHGTSEGNENG
mmetsp:Transcript_42975/g.103903  ORF Transcript_42975/g.103903 Transcript_42975/m.103903 type:complete len:782 (-) Transcript_42975:1164-3509(-)